MKPENIRIRTTKKRFDKLKLLSLEKGHTMTRMIEDWIDSLPEPTPEHNTSDK